MTREEKIKGQMINEIIGLAKSSAICNNQPFDGANMFFDLAFMEMKDLKKICKKLNIKIVC